MKIAPGTIVAHVTVSEPPADVVTLADWLVWRAAEDQRMEAEMIRQREAFYAALAEMTLRDLNGESQH